MGCVYVEFMNIKPKILLHIRDDGFDKRGGDTFLIEKFSEVFVALKYDVIVSNNPYADLENIKCVVSINYDRPFESCILLQRALNNKLPFFLYTLHHPMQGVTDYLRSPSLMGFRRVISKICFRKPFCYESFISLLKLVKNYELRAILYFRYLYIPFAQKFIAENATALLVVNDSELTQIESDCGLVIKKHKLLPHLFELNTMKNIAKEKRLVVCAGRIEPRKNQFSVLKLAEQFTDCNFVFIGAANPSSVDYYDMCIDYSKKLNNVKFIDHMDMESLRNLLAKAEVFVSLCFFEVVSLTELEAYSQYCKMLVGKQSYISRFIAGDCVSFVDVNNESLLASEFNDLLNLELNVAERASILAGNDFESMSFESIKSVFKKIVEESL